MANGQEDQNKSNVFASISKAASSTGAAMKAAAKAGAGNVVGAALDVLRNEQLRNTVIAIILLGVFLIIGVAMLCGVVVVAVVEGIISYLAEDLEEAQLESAIESGGSSRAYAASSVVDAFWAVIKLPFRLAADAVVWLGNTCETLFTTEDEVDNAELGGTDLDQNDYSRTLQAVAEQEALVGEDGVFNQRMRMIKERVQQRGIQVKTEAMDGYKLQMAAIETAYQVHETENANSLFVGIEESTVNVDTSAFELSDIQALKILAAYNIQKANIMEGIDMWDIMDYCGWYDENDKDNNWAGQVKDSIYDTDFHGFAIGDIFDNYVFSEKSIQLATPYITKWQGGCAPQWYFEEYEQAAPVERQRLKDMQSEESPENEAGNEANASGKNFKEFNLLAGYENYMNYETFGLVDRIFTTTNAELIITHVPQEDLVPTKENMEETIRELQNYLSIFPDTSVHQELLAMLHMYENIYAEVNETTPEGSTITRTVDNTHHFTTYNTKAGSKYYLKDSELGSQTSYITCEYDGQAITFYNLKPNKEYSLYRMYEVEGDPGKPGLPEVPFEPTDEANDETIGISRKDGTVTVKLETFKTLPDQSTYKPYKLKAELNITFAVRSVDDLTFNILGLWPGSLEDTEIGEDGLEYAKGYAGNPLLVKSWTDIRTDGITGEKTEITFVRGTGYQDKAFKDYCLSLATELNIDATGMFAEDFGYGDTIVDMAEKEYEYYHANNLYEGERYWRIAEKATGGLPEGIHYGSAWCVCFIMVCAYMCGYIGPGQPFGDLGNDWLYWCGGMQRNLMAAGAECYTYGYTPVPGDIVFYDTEVSEYPDWLHVGIVAGVSENGELLTIEGNYGNVVSKNTFPDYEVGSFAYMDSESNQRVLISCYVHPKYPSSYIADPVYLKIGDTLRPNLLSKNVSYERQDTLLSGVTRLRESQLLLFVDELKKKYPTLYTDALREALAVGDMDRFSNEWNTLTYYGKSELFRTAQQSITTRIFIRPIINQVFADTGFDWAKTDVREEILLGIVTTSDQTSDLVSFLKYICKDMDPEISDADFLATLKSEDFLYAAAYSFRDYLWPNDPASMQLDWSLTIRELIQAVERAYAEKEAPGDKTPPETTVP